MNIEFLLEVVKRLFSDSRVFFGRDFNTAPQKIKMGEFGFFLEFLLK